jgi:hypothetical protein
MTKIQALIEINYEITEEDIRDILSTAFSGSIDYWCSDYRIKEHDKAFYNIPIDKGGFDALTNGATLVLSNEEDDTEEWDLTLEMFVMGLIKFLKLNAHRVLECTDLDSSLYSINCGMIDSNDTDAIMQYATLGDILFG